MSTTATYPALFAADGELRGLLETGAETDGLNRLLHSLAASLTAVLTYLSDARATHAAPNPKSALGEAVMQQRKRLGLTRREAEVLTLLALGSTNREIAAELVISVRTAEHHVAHILRKLGASNRRDAAGIARRLTSAP